MQVFINVLLYVFLLYWLYESVVARDYWYCFVVLFVITVSVVVSLLPKYHASKVSPGEYPYEE